MLKKEKTTVFTINILILIVFFFTLKMTNEIGKGEGLYFLYTLWVLLFFFSLRGYDAERMISPRWTFTSISVSLFLSLIFNTLLSIIFGYRMQMEIWGWVLFYIMFMGIVNPFLFRGLVRNKEHMLVVPKTLDEPWISTIQELSVVKLRIVRGEKNDTDYRFCQNLADILGYLPRTFYESMNPETVEATLRRRKTTALLLRIIDLMIAIPAFIILLPVQIIIGVFLLILQGRPALFRQTRIGRNKKAFTLYKFRTLRLGEASCTDIEADHKRRSTPIGRVLRSLRLDELPQLINVILGHMSLVGPRPEMVYFHEMCSKEIKNYDKRLLIRPGITGWAQTMYKRSDTLEEYRVKTGYDFTFLLNYSVSMYFKSLLYTLDAIVYRKE